MRRFTAVALREITERRFVLVAAAAAAAIPLLMPLLPGVPRDQAVAARSMGALFLAFTFGVGGALLVGASVVGRELAERRLSFHFSRPLPGAVVWGGKLLGGLALVLLAEAIVVLPTAAVIRGIPSFGDSVTDTEMIRGLLLVPVPLFLLAWVGSVALRSRSPWLVVDLVLLVGLPALLFVVLRRWARFGYGPESSDVLACLGVFVVILLAATLAQVVVGRTDARRGHGAQSLTLWGLLLVGTAAGAAWGERQIDPGLAKLVRAWASPAGSGGTWVVVEGSARSSGGGRTVYLADVSTGRSILLPSTWGTLVSVEGSRAAYVAVSPIAPKKVSVSVEAIDLKSGNSVSLDLAKWPEGLALSADGRRLAVVSQGLCSVLELPSLRSLASARVPAGRWAYEPLFVSEGVVRLFPRRTWRRGAGPEDAATRPGDPAAMELDVARKALRTLATYPVSSIPVPPRKAPGLGGGPAFQLLPSPDLSRVLALGFGSAYAVRLLDAASGRVLASVDGSEESGRPTGVFLADGRAVVSEPVPEGRRIVLFAPDGSRQSEIALPAGTKGVRFGYEPAKGLLAVGLGREAFAEKRDWYVAELATGRLRPMAFDALHRAFWTETQAIPVPGSPATRLALERDTGRLVLLDPASGATKPITRGQAAAK